MNLQPLSLLIQYSRLFRIAALASTRPTQAMALALALPAVPGALRLRKAVAGKVVRCHRNLMGVRG